MNARRSVERTIAQHDIIAPGDQVVLGLSGGPDSLCLLHILTELQTELGFSLSCVHVNHLMRGAQAEEDVRWLSAHCKEIGIPLTVERCDVKARALREKITVEEAGRKARQEALFARARAEAGACRGRVRVALAHNRDDQAETVLLRMLRGTGVHGLAAMEHCRADGLIRPLLDTPRREVEAYCLEKALSPRWDSTNASPAFTRNRLRLELIPLLEERFNPGVRESLARLADNAREDDRCLEALASEKALLARPPGDSPDGPACLAYPFAALAALDPALGKRLIRLLFERVGLSEDIASVHLNALWEVLKRPAPGAVIEFPGGFRARIAGEEVLFKAPGPQELCLPLPLWHLTTRRMPAEQAPDPGTLPPHQALLDAAKVEALGLPLTLRTRQPKDRIHPLGSKGSKKLQDYFVDAKVPRDLRNQIPLVCCGDQILFIRGGALSETVKVTEDSKYVLLLDISREIC